MAQGTWRVDPEENKKLQIKSQKRTETKPSNWPKLPRFDPVTAKAYKERREHIDRLMTDLEGLEKNSLEFARRYRILKARVSTDPLIWKSHERWAGSQRGKDVYGKSLLDHAHHRNGLDDYFPFLKNLDETELFKFHNQMAKRGHYFGNHPKNLKFLYPDEHKGSTSSFSPYVDSAHGQYDYTRLKDSGEFDSFVENYLKTGSTLNDSKGHTSDKLERRRFNLPTEDQLDDMSIEQIIDTATWFAEEDCKSLQYLERRGITEGPGAMNTARDALPLDATSEQKLLANRALPEGTPSKIKSQIKRVGGTRVLLGTGVIEALEAEDWVGAAALIAANAYPPTRAINNALAIRQEAATGETLRQANQRFQEESAAGVHDYRSPGTQTATTSMALINPANRAIQPYGRQFRPSDSRRVKELQDVELQVSNNLNVNTDW